MAAKVIIYGGSGGIGSAMGRMLRAPGHDLHLVGRSEDKLSLANELPRKVRVSAIAPSLTRTQLAKDLLSNAQMVAPITEMHALQRLGIAQDVASITAFLLSPEADLITDQVIGVGGDRSTMRIKD